MTAMWTDCQPGLWPSFSFGIFQRRREDFGGTCLLVDMIFWQRQEKDSMLCTNDLPMEMWYAGIMESSIGLAGT
jgi:hypothetical protein